MKQATTREEIIQRLNSLKGYDPEVDHEEADSLLLDALLLLKADDVVDAYIDARFRCKFKYA